MEVQRLLVIRCEQTEVKCKLLVTFCVLSNSFLPPSAVPRFTSLIFLLWMADCCDLSVSNWHIFHFAPRSSNWERQELTTAQVTWTFLALLLFLCLVVFWAILLSRKWRSNMLPWMCGWHWGCTNCILVALEDGFRICRYPCSKYCGLWPP